MNARVRSIFVVVCVFAISLASALVPASAQAQSEPPEYLPALGQVISVVQTAGQNQACYNVSALSPLMPEQVVQQAAVRNGHSVFLPMAVSGPMCTELDPFLNGTVFIGEDERVILPRLGGSVGFDSGNLPFQELVYELSESAEPELMWELAQQELPEDIRSLKLLGAYHLSNPQWIESASAEGVVPAQVGDSPASLQQWLNGNRAVVMDERIGEGAGLEFLVDPRKTRICRAANELTCQPMVTLCPALSTFAAVAVHPIGFFPFPYASSRGTEIVFWAYVEYNQSMINLCGGDESLLPLHPYIPSDVAFNALPELERQSIDDEVERRTREWSSNFLLNPNPAFAVNPPPQPVYAEGKHSGLVIGGVVIVIVVVAAAVLTAQPMVLVFALVP